VLANRIGQVDYPVALTTGLPASCWFAVYWMVLKVLVNRGIDRVGELASVFPVAAAGSETGPQLVNKPKHNSKMM
jgi:hypothetical protein